jgi:hypothetical protein
MNESTTYLQIGDTFRVSRDDDRNLMLEQFKTVKSAPNRHQKEYKTTDKWVWVGFFNDLGQVMNRVLKEKIGANLDGELHDLIAVIDDAKQEIFDAVDEAGIKLESFPKAEDGRGKKTVEVAKVSSKKTPKKVAKRKAKELVKA